MSYFLQVYTENEKKIKNIIEISNNWNEKLSDCEVLAEILDEDSDSLDEFVLNLNNLEKELGVLEEKYALDTNIKNLKIINHIKHRCQYKAFKNSKSN